MRTPVVLDNLMFYSRYLKLHKVVYFKEISCLVYDCGHLNLQVGMFVWNLSSHSLLPEKALRQFVID